MSVSVGFAWLDVGNTALPAIAFPATADDDDALADAAEAAGLVALALR